MSASGRCQSFTFSKSQRILIDMVPYLDCRMGNCCSSETCATTENKRRACPVNGIEYLPVKVRTITHHLKQPWTWTNGEKNYYFCEDPTCEVAYFADDDSVILTSQLRTEIGVKTPHDDALLCYCFGITLSDAKRDPSIREYVVQQTGKKICSCETSNPSGRCCLKDFPLSG